MLKPFRFWCQKVLPLVYDDSLSYYELLCKVVNYVNTEAESINNLNEIVKELKEYLENYFIEPTEFRYNIAYAVDDNLTSDNFAEAFNKSILSYKYIYIPSGNYNFDTIGRITVNKDLDILLADDAVLYTEENTDGMFDFNNCSITWNGGTVHSGLSRVSHDLIYKAVADGGRGLMESMITLNGCKNCHFTNINCEYSKLPGVITLIDTTRVRIDYSYFGYSVESAIRIFDHCVDTVVDNCEINEVYIPANHYDLNYCYAVATGIQHLTDLNITPPDILVYSNNIVKRSEDSALDTHGATNVQMINNTILDCSTAITAYNDNRRVKRPAGWTMKNILIENNVCKSDISNYEATGHPYILLGAANSHKSTESGYEDNPGTFDSFDNLVFRNNYVSSPNLSPEGIISLNRASRNVIIENNVIDGEHTAAHPLVLTNCIDFALRNNSVENTTSMIQFNRVYGEIDNNSGSIAYNQSGINYVKGLDGNDMFTGSPWAVRAGDIFYGTSDGKQHLTTSYGLRAILSRLPEAVNQSFEITVSNGVATAADNQMIPGLALNLTGDINVYVDQVIDFEHFTLIRANSQPPADGTYTATIRDAQTVALN